MFYGTTPQIISQFLAEELGKKKPKRVIVPFAGNFVIEQVAGSVHQGIEILSTDISLYSRLIGYGLAGVVNEKIRLKRGIEDFFPRFANLSDPIDKAVAGIFFAEVGQIMKKQHIPYYAGLLKDAVSGQEKYFDDIKRKILLVKEKIGNIEFLGVDGCKLIEMAEPGDFVFYDPPVILGDYEKMFAPMEACFEFDSPEYTEMNEEVKERHLQHFVDKGIDCMYRVNNVVPPPSGYNEVFRYQYKYHAFYCVFSNRKDSNLFIGRFNPMKEENKSVPIIGIDDEITENSKIEVIQAPSNLGNHYRLMWVKKAEMSDAGNTYFIMCDGKLIGLLVVENAMKFGNTLAVIYSDPAAPSSQYKRLSKLIINICCTKTFIEEFNDICMWEHTGFTTRVFSNNPVSMKYRNLFTLAKREETKNGYYKYNLIYQNRENIFENFNEALKSWLKKDGKITKNLKTS